VIQKTDELEALKIGNKECEEMIKEGMKRETALKAELKKKNIQKSTLRATHHNIWDTIKRIISVDWPHMVLAQEEV